jgi:hypothetical protein
MSLLVGNENKLEETNMSASKQAEIKAVEQVPVLRKTKPVVYYIEALAPIVVGLRAAVTAYEHYRLGRCSPLQGEYLNTSPVVAVGEDGTTFETQNTMYVLREPVEDDEPAIAESEVEYHPV